MRRGANLPRIGDFNQTVVLDAIRRAPQGLSRVEMAASTGLSAQSVTNICRRLLDSGLVQEVGKHNVGPGKPRTILKLNPGGQFAVGVHLDPTVTTYVLLDLEGHLVAHTSHHTSTAGEPKMIIDSMVETIDRLIDGAGVARQRVLGIGVAVPGPVDVAAGIVVNPPLLFGWHNVRLREALRDSTGMPVLLEKDVTAAAVAEAWASGQAQEATFAFMYFGTGYGAGLAVRGEVLRGSSGNAGEIGHMMVATTGPECVCGLRGGIGMLCTPNGLVQEAVTKGVIGHAVDGTNAIAVDEAFTELCSAAKAGDRMAAKIIDKSAERVARVASYLVDILDADQLIFGGPYWNRVSERYLQVVPAVVDSVATARSVHPVAVRSTSFGEDVGAIGAASLVLDHTFSPHPSVLLLGTT